MPTPPGQKVFQLRIELNDVHPVVWRRVLVPGSIRLAKLHNIFQAAMGWTNSHLHAFSVGDQRYGMKSDDLEEDELDEKDFTVLAALGDRDRFFYEYDFGDSWEHTVTVEAITTATRGLKFAVCLDGQQACPPEDCGGSHGYAQMLEAIANPSHEEHHEFLEWLGGPFDPTTFSVAGSNAQLQGVR